MKPTPQETRAQAIRHLRDQGRYMREDASMSEIAAAILGKQLPNRHAEFVRGWVAEQPALPEPVLASPSQINLMKREDFIWSHPRAAEIDQGQPPMITPNGIGNVKQPGGFIPVVDKW